MERRNFFKSSMTSLAGLFLLKNETKTSAFEIAANKESKYENPYSSMDRTYDVVNAIDLLLKYSHDARWDVVGRAMEVLEGGFTKKMIDDGGHILLDENRGVSNLHHILSGTLESVSYTTNNANNELQITATLKPDGTNDIDIRDWHNCELQDCANCWGGQLMNGVLYVDVDIPKGMHVNPGSYVQAMLINNIWTVISVCFSK